MPRKPSARVVLNRAALTDLGLGVADGVMEFGRTIIETADPPDAEPFGKGLITSGGVLVYVDGQKVDGWSELGTQPKPPRTAQVSRAKGLILAIVGWGFPGRFQEIGTVNHPPQPFAIPAADAVTPHASRIIGPSVRARLG